MVACAEERTESAFVVVGSGLGEDEVSGPLLEFEEATTSGHSPPLQSAVTVTVTRKRWSVLDREGRMLGIGCTHQ